MHEGDIMEIVSR